MFVEFPLLMSVKREEGVFIPDSLSEGEAEALAEWLAETIPHDSWHHLFKQMRADFDEEMLGEEPNDES